MISKSQIKLITSLHQKKYRVKTGFFIAEGAKIIQDLLEAGLKLHALYSTSETMPLAQSMSSNFDHGVSPEEVSKLELKKISALKTANTMLAVFYQPKETTIVDEGLIVVLDQVRDPGNLGTIIRLCDWFGVKQLICAIDTVDCFNPKVVQATMGSIARVSVVYTDLVVLLESSAMPVYAAMMEGDSVYHSTLAQDAILVMGNEGSGISAEVSKFIQYKITIPNFSVGPSAESLNVATATGIILSEFRRLIER